MFALNLAASRVLMPCDINKANLKVGNASGTREVRRGEMSSWHFEPSYRG